MTKKELLAKLADIYRSNNAEMDSAEIAASLDGICEILTDLLERLPEETLRQT